MADVEATDDRRSAEPDHAGHGMRDGRRPAVCVCHGEPLCPDVEFPGLDDDDVGFRP